MVVNSPPHEPAEASARSGKRELESLLGRARLDSLEKGVIGKVRIPLGGLVTGVNQNLADRKEIDAAIDHERRRRVP